MFEFPGFAVPGRRSNLAAENPLSAPVIDVHSAGTFPQPVRNAPLAGGPSPHGGADTLGLGAAAFRTTVQPVVLAPPVEGRYPDWSSDSVRFQSIRRWAAVSLWVYNRHYPPSSLLQHTCNRFECPPLCRVLQASLLEPMVMGGGAYIHLI